MQQPNTIIRTRWTKEDVLKVYQGYKLRVPIGRTFAVTFIETNTSLNGFWKNIKDEDIAVLVTPTNTAAFEAYIAEGVIEKRDIPEWVPHTRYMINDEVYIKDEWTAIWTSLMDFNYQAVFQPEWYFGGVAPDNIVGLFTFPSGRYDNMDLARREKGAPYYAWDKHVLYAHTGKEGKDDTGVLDNGYKSLMTINEYDDTLKYDIGDVVSGRLRGRFPNGNHIIETYGIFRREIVNIWNKFYPDHLVANGFEHQFPADGYFYVDEMQVSTQYNGIYRAVVKTSVHISEAAKDTVQFDQHLANGDIVKVSETPSPSVDPKEQVLEYAPGKVYNVLDLVHDYDKYDAFYACNYNNYIAPSQPEWDDVFLGWTCLADLFDTEDYPDVQHSYIYRGRKGDFPAEGRYDTVYIDAITDTMWYWNGTDYASISAALSVDSYIVDIKFDIPDPGDPYSQTYLSWEMTKRDPTYGITHSVTTLESIDERFKINTTRVLNGPAGSDAFLTDIEVDMPFDTVEGLWYEPATDPNTGTTLPNGILSTMTHYDRGLSARKNWLSLWEGVSGLKIDMDFTDPDKPHIRLGVDSLYVFLEGFGLTKDIKIEKDELVWSLIDANGVLHEVRKPFEIDFDSIRNR